MPKTRIMIVEDEWLIADELGMCLKKLDYEVTSIENTGEGAVKRAGEDRPDLVLMDIALKKKLNGIGAARQIKNSFSIPHIFMTAYTNKDLLDQAKTTEPYGYLLKPYNEEELKASIEMALYKHKMETDLKIKSAEVQNINELFIGRELMMIKLKNEIKELKKEIKELKKKKAETA